MKKRKISIFLSFLIIFTGVMFFNVENVKALGTPNGKGYSECEYYWSKSSGTIGSNTFGIGIVVFKNTNGKYEGYANVGCSTSGTFGTDVIGKGKCKLTNKASVFNNNSQKLGNKFHSNGKWKCPTVYIKSRFGSEDISLSLTEKSGYEAVKIVSNAGYDGTIGQNLSKQTGSPNSESGDISGNSAYSTIDDGNMNDVPLEGDPEGINEWAKKYNQNSTIGDDYNSCEIISENAREYIGGLLFLVSIAGVIILIVLTSFELLKALVSSDDNKISKILKTLVVRIICVVVLLLLPFIVTSAINLINYASENGIIQNDDPLCNIDKK